MAAGLLGPFTTDPELESTHQPLSPILQAFVQDAVVVTNAGIHIELQQHLLAAALPPNHQHALTTSTDVYLPLDLGGAADWDSEFPEACFHMLSNEYLDTFPGYRGQLRQVLVTLMCLIITPFITSLHLPHLGLGWRPSVMVCKAYAQHAFEVYVWL